MKRFNKTTGIALLFLLPNLGGFVMFLLVPIVLSVAMAFTSWSLKPAVTFEFVGLRNFLDILGVRALESGHTRLLAGYLCACTGVGVGLVGHLWVAVEGTRGLRWAATLFMILGLILFCGAWRADAPQGVYIAAGVLVALGALTNLREGGDWRIGSGVVPALLLVAGVLMMAALHGRLWNAYEVRDQRFWSYLYNTLHLMLGMPIAIFGSLGLAMLINSPLTFSTPQFRVASAAVCLVSGVVAFALLHGAGMPNGAVVVALFLVLCASGAVFNVVSFRTVYYLPSFTAGVALMVLWKALYNPESGPINMALEQVFALAGLELRGPRWLVSVTWAKPALIIMGIWTAIGGMNMLLYLAGLSTVSRDLLDAAEVDGAGRWTRFRHVVWPHLAPTTFFITVISIIGGLQGGFEQARVMTLGGPAGSTTTLSYYIYNIAFGELDLGRAAAISWVLFALVFTATAINWKFGKGQEVDY